MLATQTEFGRDAPGKPGIVAEAKGIVKRYPGTVALKGVDFRVYARQVNVLVGENGAGKSTLMKILAGVELPSEGRLFVEGRPVVLESVRDAVRFGITMVHQDLNLLPNLSVAENIFAGRELCNQLGWLRSRRQEEESTRALKLLRHPLAPRSEVGLLPLGHQQIVELARAITQQTKVLILDEPTSALSPAEVQVLFRVLGQLKQNGVSILYVSHRLNELLEIGNFFTVLRDGQVVGEADRAAVDRQWLIERMTGKTAFQPPQATVQAADAAEALSVHSLGLIEALPNGHEKVVLENVSFALRRGEVLGIYGLLGAGRTELLECLAGLRPWFRGEVRLKGKAVSLGSVVAAISSGMALAPEDRKQAGVVPELSIRENISLMGLRQCCTGPWISRSRELEQVRRLTADLNMKADDLELPITSLSGGNQQKAILARCLMCRPSVLLLDEPTRGVDVGAKAEIYRILRGLAAQGLSVLFTTSEAEEMRALADRCLVLSRGRIIMDSDVSRLTEEQLYSAASRNQDVPEQVR